MKIVLVLFLLLGVCFAAQETLGPFDVDLQDDGFVVTKGGDLEIEFYMTNAGDNELGDHDSDGVPIGGFERELVEGSFEYDTNADIEIPQYFQDLLNDEDVELEFEITSSFEIAPPGTTDTDVVNCVLMGASVGNEDDATASFNFRGKTYKIKNGRFKFDLLLEWPSPHDDKEITAEFVFNYEVNKAGLADDFATGNTDVNVEQLDRGVEITIGKNVLSIDFLGGVMALDADGNEDPLASEDFVGFFVEDDKESDTKGSITMRLVFASRARIVIDPEMRASSASGLSSWMTMF